VGVISVGVMTIRLGLTLMVIAFGIPWPYGNGNLSFRLRRNQSYKSNDGEDQEEKLFHLVTFYYNTEWQMLPDYAEQSENRFCHTRKQR
jgi:hypothetical protein